MAGRTKRRHSSKGECCTPNCQLLALVSLLGLLAIAAAFQEQATAGLLAVLPARELASQLPDAQAFAEPVDRLPSSASWPPAIQPASAPASSAVTAPRTHSAATHPPAPNAPAPKLPAPRAPISLPAPPSPPKLPPADWAPAPPHGSEACIAGTMPRPGPLVTGPEGSVMEVSFLNGDLSGKGFLTSGKCAKPWDGDGIGRPIIDTTATLLSRAIRVGHPKNGLLDPKSDILIPKPCVRPVPKILHFIWICSPLSEQRAQRVLSFAELNPRYKIFVWLDEELPKASRKILDKAAARVEIKDVYEEAKTFQSFRVVKYLDKFHVDNKNPGVCTLKSHFFRLEAPLKYGGIYIDADHHATRGFDEFGNGDVFRWPFVTHKVCGANIGNHIFSGDQGSGFLDFAVKVIMERCEKLSSCNVLEGTGPPPFAMSALRYNSSDMAFIGVQEFGRLGIAAHENEHTWR
eukprot:TRINITY_DN95122_c0_g1_i1.p1 TRINITY_DN95122_c0_g1~~TRINITY_DN95122_c0_g1_i1.p1  ORF type:complete len:461 (+),score=82.67 TRINITY_DN95122_c0_g1_i1:57-1439(+)